MIIRRPTKTPSRLINVVQADVHRDSLVTTVLSLSEINLQKEFSVFGLANRRKTVGFWAKHNKSSSIFLVSQNLPARRKQHRIVSGRSWWRCTWHEQVLVVH